MGTYGSILSKDADAHGRDKGIPDDRKRWRREMKPINFKEQNVIYIAEECNDLPVHKTKDQIISCWKLTKEELEQINKTGVIWFSVMGQSQPPIWLGTENPFKEE